MDFAEFDQEDEDDLWCPAPTCKQRMKSYPAAQRHQNACRKYIQWTNTQGTALRIPREMQQGTKRRRVEVNSGASGFGAASGHIPSLFPDQQRTVRVCSFFQPDNIVTRYAQVSGAAASNTSSGLNPAGKNDETMIDTASAPAASALATSSFREEMLDTVTDSARLQAPLDSNAEYNEFMVRSQILRKFS